MEGLYFYIRIYRENVLKSFQNLLGQKKSICVKAFSGSVDKKNCSNHVPRLSDEASMGDQVL